MPKNPFISAIVLAAGSSTRMGRPKMLLPWGETTILGKVINTLQSAGLENILVVTGGDRLKVEGEAARLGAYVVFNEAFKSGEMLSSLQCGISHLDDHTSDIGPFTKVESTMICLGDQPQIKVHVIQSMIHGFLHSGRELVIPSYDNHRGHPWLVGKKFWGEILGLKSPQTPRDFLNRHKNEIEFVEVDDSSVITDIDTMDDYLKTRP